MRPTQQPQALSDLLVPTLGPVSSERTEIRAPGERQGADWRSEYAFAAGVRAFIYCFPYIYNAQLRHAGVTRLRESARLSPAVTVRFSTCSNAEADITSAINRPADGVGPSGPTWLDG
jgi:hypothetical protein